MCRIIYLTSCLLSFLTIQMRAQPTYGTENYLTTGESEVISVYNPIDFSYGLAELAKIGANQEWNFSNLDLSYQASIGFEDKDATGFRTAFTIGCLTQFADFGFCNGVWNEQIDYARNEPTGIPVLGGQLDNLKPFQKNGGNYLIERVLGLELNIGSLPLQQIAITYLNPDTIYQFPLEYGQEYDNTSYYRIDLNAANIPLILSQKKRRSTRVVGYGRCLTPFGEFDEVLMLHSDISQSDTTILSGQEIIQESQINEYEWFSASQKLPILTIVVRNMIGETNTYSITYLDSLRCLEPTASFIPDAQQKTLENGEAQFAFSNNSSQFTSALWDFGDGTQDTSIVDASHTYSEVGEYQVSLVVCNDVCDPPLCDEVNFTITVDEVSSALEESAVSESYVHYDHQLKRILVKHGLIDNNVDLDIRLYNNIGQNIPLEHVKDQERLRIYDAARLIPGVYYVKWSRGQHKIKVMKFVIF